jgi:uncharacterized integral membrane protein
MNKGKVEKMGVKMNFGLSVVALVIVIVGCLLAVRLSFSEPVSLNKEKVTSLIRMALVE